MARMLRRPQKPGSMTGRQQAVYEKALHAISLSRRRKMPLRLAAREAHTTVAAIRRYAKSAVIKRHGEWVPKPRDKLERRMLLYDERGHRLVTVEGSVRASLISRYHHTVRRFVETGDPAQLRQFAGRSVIDVEGRRHSFMTAPDALRRIARAGVLRFEFIY